MTTFTIRPVLLAAMLATSPAGIAQTAEFRLHRADLQSSEGRGRVLTRIRHVAERACPRSGHMVRTPAYTSCVTELSADMVRSTKSGELLAAFEGRGETQLAGKID